jgi:hypothetical protein
VSGAKHHRPQGTRPTSPRPPVHRSGRLTLSATEAPASRGISRCRDMTRPSLRRPASRRIVATAQVVVRVRLTNERPRGVRWHRRCLR